jgi:hypothetical protein
VFLILILIPEAVLSTSRSQLPPALSSFWSPLAGRTSAQNRLVAALLSISDAHVIPSQCWTNRRSERRSHLLRPITKERNPPPEDPSTGIPPGCSLARDFELPKLLCLETPHASGNPSRWLSHRGVTSFRHTHATPPVSDESHPQLQGSPALICTHARTCQEVPRGPWNMLRSNCIPEHF